MISTVSISFDLTYTDPSTGTVIPRCVVTDTTDYSNIADFDIVSQQAKGYGVITFNGDVIQQKNTISNPLINLEDWDFSSGLPTGYFDLPLDLNGNVANGVYGITYSLRLTDGIPSPTGTISGNTFTISGYEWMVDFFEVGDSVRFFPSGIGVPITRNIVSIQYSGGNTIINFDGSSASSGSYTLDYNVSNSQFSATYTYAGCTQTTANVDFVYDCDYGDSGTWSVSNATQLGLNEVVSSLSCTVNYPSWTTVSPIFPGNVTTTVLPYPPAGADTPLATGTYSVSLTQQIQQTQASGLIIIYNTSITKEFTVSCAGTLCGLLPCIENLRNAHASELQRNKISKYQVFVDNVLMYYIEAMNYRSCGELDKYKETIALLEAQIDASGCECSCCDDETYYWISNNSATSVIDSLLSAFQFRLSDNNPTASDDITQGFQVGAWIFNVNTLIVWRCTNNDPGNATWVQYYSTTTASAVTATPSANYLTGSNVQSQLNQASTWIGTLVVRNDDVNDDIDAINNDITQINLDIDATNQDVLTITNNYIKTASGGLTKSIVGGFYDVKLGGTLGSDVIIDQNSYDITFSTNDSRSENTGVLVLNNRTRGDETQPVLYVQSRALTPASGFGTAIQFTANIPNSNTQIALSNISSSWVGSPSNRESKFSISLSKAGGTQATRFEIDNNGQLQFLEYGGGGFTDSPTFALAVNNTGKVIEIPVPKVYVATISQTGTNDPTSNQIINTTGATTLSWTRTGLGEYTLTASSGVFTSKTAIFVTSSATALAGPVIAMAYRATATTCIVKTADSFANFNDGLLNAATVKIEIYP